MINDFLVGILNGINSVVNNYGLSIIVFTILIKLVLMPFDYKSRKSMRRMTTIQPQVAKLQKKYANDKEKLNTKTAELYRKEKINPLSGCVPMLLSFPVLIAMFGAMRYVANLELAHQAIDLLVNPAEVFQPEGFLWVKNLWMPDSPFTTIMPDKNNLAMIPADVWARVMQSFQGTDTLTALSHLGIDANSINGEVVYNALFAMPSYQEQVALWGAMPNINLIFFNLNIYAHHNGWFILPVLAAVTQLLMTLTQPQQPAANEQAAKSNKIMMYFFPIFSLFICSSYNAAFAIYWVAANVFAWVQGIYFNRLFAKQEAAAQEVVDPTGGSLK